MPYLLQPEDVVAGRSQYYASTCGACAAGCGLLVKVRDGRPIKLEGNPDQAISRGATCAVGQASILGLYDSLRLKQPLAKGKPAKWEQVDREIVARLGEIRRAGGEVRYLSETVTSPTFTIMNSYKGRLDLYHYDMYRIEKAEDLYELGIYDNLFNGGVSVIEWNKFDLTGLKVINVDIEYEGNDRRITVL
jgi:molybdopterin-containing oxidoreductase family iron-sulfur binding subunit